MFETIIGELDTILLNLKLGKTFESAIMEIFLAHEEEGGQIRKELDQFGGTGFWKEEPKSKPQPGKSSKGGVATTLKELVFNFFSPCAALTPCRSARASGRLTRMIL